MPDVAPCHVSSALVTARPERAVEIAEAIGRLPGTEVHHVAGGKIVVVMEGPDSDCLGARLAAIALMDGVFSANMVFEQAESLEDTGVSP
ncbi:MAG: glutamate synthase subunit beta [Alphaproteobacteria bacterium]|nr:MAG: glutamate synthase subunit beta [Alphaproteobacteria bacterium]